MFYSQHLLGANFILDVLLSSACVCAQSCLSFTTLWIVARQAPLSMEFPGKNAGVGCHFLLHTKLWGDPYSWRNPWSWGSKSMEKLLIFFFLLLLQRVLSNPIRSGETFLLVVAVILISYRTKRTCIREIFLSLQQSREIFFIKYLLSSKLWAPASLR